MTLFYQLVSTFAGGDYETQRGFFPTSEEARLHAVKFLGDSQEIGDHFVVYRCELGPDKDRVVVWEVRRR